MIYRLGVESDLEQLAGLRWDFRTENTPPPEGITREIFSAACLGFLREALDSGRWAIWVAEQDGLIIGQLFVQRIRKIPNPRRLEAEFGYVTNVYTRPAYRNQGVGAELLRRAQEWGRAAGLEMFVLWPSKRSGRFYARAGFHPSPEALEYPFT